MNFLNFLIYIQRTAERAYNSGLNPLEDMRNSGMTNLHFEYYTQNADFFLSENTSSVISDELSIDAGNTVFVLLDNSSGDENNKVVLFYGGWRVHSNGFSQTRLYQ